jgi:hypothetical protein
MCGTCRYHLSDDTGKLLVKEITARPLKKEFLKTGDAYVLQTGPSGVWAWVGKKVGNQGIQRESAYHFVSLYLPPYSVFFHFYPLVGVGFGVGFGVGVGVVVGRGVRVRARCSVSVRARCGVRAR